MGKKKMGKGKKSSHDKKNGNQTKVVLNVYDLTPINKYSYWIGLGIFHSGIEVHGKEYGFGAHDFPISGVFEVEPKSCSGYAYRCSISFGVANMSPSEIRELIQNMAGKYHGNSYHLISKNCNHFTNDIVHRLTGKKIPGWVNRLARLGSLFNCILPKSLQATKVKKIPGHLETEEGIETLSYVEHLDSSEIDGPDKELLLSPKEKNKNISFVQEAQGDSKKL